MLTEYSQKNYYRIGGLNVLINWEKPFALDSYTEEHLEWQFLPSLMAYEIPSQELPAIKQWDIIVNMSCSELTPYPDSKVIPIETQFYDISSDDFAFELRDTPEHVDFRIETLKKDNLTINLIRNEEISPFRRLRHLGAAFQQIMPYFNGFVMHGAGIEVRGKGVVFTAFSGTGKTTQARLWQKYKNTITINGDSPLIMQTEQGVRMFGTPWCGSSGESINRNVPLGAIVLLERSLANHVEEITGDEAVLAVYTSVLYFSRNKNDFDLMFPVFEKIIRQIKVYRLLCNMEEDAVNTLDEALKKDGI